ncbi:nuclear transport factor 2 family protein [Candidatus Bipolaricaulota bacterium]|nr:nuclear transport factor 2 family protein [Candidatus Bipolaricaulota bacterium]
MSQDRQQIVQVIESAYIDGIHTNPNLEVVLSGFHPEFRMLVRKEAELTKVSPEEFVAMVLKGRAANPDAFKSPVSFEIPLVEVTGDAAIARVDLSRGGNLLFTDYLSLYRMDGRWQVVSKIFHSYPR